MNSKKWLRIWFVLFLLVPIIAGFNYYIDSLGIINKDSYLDNAAKDLSKGNIIAGLKNFDERIFNKKVIENLNKEIKWIALGSSRTMQLRERMFLNEKGVFQNYSVSGGSLEDYLALLQVHYNKFKKFPKNIILGIDPWIFNKNSKQNRYMSLFNEYNQFLKNLGISNKQTEKSNFLKLFSLEYTKENYKFIKNNISNNLKGYYIVDTLQTDDYLREGDGSIHYSYKIKKPKFDLVKKNAILYASGKVYSIENFTKISNKNIFERFIKYLIDNKINLYFYLPPYNPYSYDKLMEREYFIINEVEDYVRSYAIENSIKIIGSYNPHRNDLSNNYFFDGMHTLDNAYYKLFKNLLK